MQGIIKSFSKNEGIGVIEAGAGRFHFSLSDFTGGLPQEGQQIRFKDANKKISINDELLPLAIKVIGD